MADIRIPTPETGTLDHTPATSTACRQAIADALSAALYCLQVTCVPNHIWLAGISARRALAMLDSAYAEIQKSEGAGHAL